MSGFEVLSFVLGQGVFLLIHLRILNSGKLFFGGRGTGFGYCMVNLCFSNLLAEAIRFGAAVKR